MASDRKQDAFFKPAEKSSDKKEDTIIFQKMPPTEGYKILRQNVKEGGFTWLLRESNAPGMLTVDYIYNDGQAMQQNSLRLALTHDGWCNASSKEQYEKAKSKMLEQLTKDNAGKHIKSLFEVLEKMDLYGYKIKPENRVNPSPQQQTKNELYGDYSTIVFDGFLEQVIVDHESKSGNEHKNVTQGLPDVPGGPHQKFVKK